jgi:hypothetical protein
MDRRTEEQRLRGVIPITWGGEVREVPTLKRGASRVWKDAMASALQEVGTLQVGAVESLALAGNMAGDRMLDLVLEYDTTHVLGTREWVDENVDDTEVYQALRTFADVAYPFVSDLRGVLAEVRGMGLLGTVAAKPSALPDSTNGRSPSGASPRRKSTPV